MLVDFLVKNRINKFKYKFSSQKKLISNLTNEIIKLKSELSECENEKVALYDYNSTIFFTIDNNLLIKQLNFQAASFLGVDRKYVTDHLILDFLSLNSKNTFQQTVQAFLDLKFIQSCEIEIIQNDGGRRFATVECVLLQNKLIHIRLIDITNTRQLMLQVLEQEKSLHLFNKLFEHTDDAIAILDEKLRVKLHNQNFYEIFTKIFSIKIQNGIDISLVLADFPDIKMEIINGCHSVTTNSAISVMLESDICHSETYCYEVQISSVYNIYSSENEFIFNIKNRSESKVLENHQNRLNTDIALTTRTSTIDEISSIFSHEIKQPLTAIIAYSRSCLFILKNRSWYKLMYSKLLIPLEQIALQAEHSVKIVHNMKNAIFHGNIDFACEDINAIIKETLSIIDFELPDFKLIIQLNLMDNLPLTKVNKIHIMQVILNLVRNSIESLQDELQSNSEIIIRTSEKNGFILVDIIDNGPGIPIDIQHKILKTYFTTKPHGQGVGLGVSRSLIEAHGGEMLVHFHNKKGAWFTFTLPIIQ